MSLDGGYIGSLDHALANLYVGREQGYNEGYQQGFHDGSKSGWNEAMAVANERLQKYIAERDDIIREHIAENERITGALVRQREQIDQLEARMAGLERENATLREANKKLQERATELDAKLQERTRQYVDQIWQYNRTLTFANSTRLVLEELASDNAPNANHVRRLFAEKYALQVSEGLQEGALKVAPDADDEFAKKLPKTRKFIVDMLSAAEKDTSQVPEENAAR